MSKDWIDNSKVTLPGYIEYKSSSSTQVTQNVSLPSYIESSTSIVEYNGGKSSKGEDAAREAMQKVFGSKFIKVRPRWLEGLELDGYNSKLGIAFEYNGRQHYEYVPFFHKNGISDLYRQIDNDNRKLDICDKRGVYVIVIPYTVNNYEEFIRSNVTAKMMKRMR